MNAADELASHLFNGCLVVNFLTRAAKTQPHAAATARTPAAAAAPVAVGERERGA